ncbi:hypothetical protein SAMN05192552_10633 [Natrinema hispanicum]|uniref:Uncharacterized protein n=1 Tax=Natrinema hispanicum TaxID=392421 RepID=A0A1G6YB63_9EURY|nr:hypothetical protein SAMN05192552_10633 [Natrinema hispanicum]
MDTCWQIIINGENPEIVLGDMRATAITFWHYPKSCCYSSEYVVPTYVGFHLIVFYLRMIDSFLRLMVLCLDEVSTVLTTSFDCVGCDSAITLGTRAGARVGLDVFVECCLVNLFESHGVHEGRCVTLTASHLTRGAEKPLYQETVAEFLYSGFFVKLAVRIIRPYSISLF